VSVVKTEFHLNRHAHCDWLAILHRGAELVLLCCVDSILVETFVHRTDYMDVVRSTIFVHNQAQHALSSDTLSAGKIRILWGGDEYWLRWSDTWADIKHWPLHSGVVLVRAARFIRLLLGNDRAQWEEKNRTKYEDADEHTVWDSTT